MRVHTLSAEDQKLIDKATDLAKKRRSERTSVAAVLKTKDKRIFQGVNIEVSGSAPSSFCAEYAAVGAMVSDGAVPDSDDSRCQWKEECCVASLRKLQTAAKRVREPIRHPKTRQQAR